MLELKRPVIFFDLETTGVDPNNSRIVELATVKLFLDGSKEVKCRRFNPRLSIPEEASKVHGIFYEDVENESTFSELAKSIVSYFKGCDLGGYNIIKFDIPCLKAELARCDLSLDTTNINIIDVYNIFCKKVPRTLEGALRYYCNEDHIDSHSALGDVEATISVLEAQLNTYDDIPKTVEGVYEYIKPDGCLDLEGKLCIIEGEVIINFGKYKGVVLRKLVSEDAGYVRWMLQNNVVSEYSYILNDALNGKY